MVWVCKEIPTNDLLDICKACRTDRSYAKSYNATAHLQRAHINLLKPARGDDRVSGSNKPSLLELQQWTFVMYETTIVGKDVETSPVLPKGENW